MNPTDHWTDLKSAGQVPPPSPEVLAHARRQLETKAIRTRRSTIKRRWMVPVLAGAGATAAVIGAVAVYQTGSGPLPVGGSTPSVLPSRPGSSATAPSRKPSQGIAASCVVGYSPAELKKSAFAFDGTVLDAVEDHALAIPTYLVTMRVEEWFRPSNGPEQVTVRMYRAPGAGSYRMPSEFGPEYEIGGRLLITGQPQSGGQNPFKDPVAWGCGFSRTYNAGDAATWRKILK